MVNFKKYLACALVATMVFGSSITAFAEDPDPNTGSATVTGSGTSEGHVDKDKMQFVLPTTTASTFAYTMDPERLIQATSAAAHSGMTFPATASDSGVYFQTNDTTFANTSSTVNAINKGSADATLTVKVKTVGASTDIPLATEALTDADSTAEGATAKLYLAASIGGKDTILKADEQTITAVVPGNASNYEVVYADNAYSYQVKSTGLTAWKAIAVNVTGAVTNGLPIASTTTAPQISFTWSFAKKGTSDTSTEGVSTVDYSDAPTTFTVTYKSNYTDGPEDATESVTANGNPTGPETAFTRTGYTLAGWATTADGEAAALTSYTITGATTLHAIWTKDPVEGYAEYNSSKFWLGTSSSAGFETGKTPSSVTVAGKDVTAKVAMATFGGTDWITVAWADCTAAGVVAADSYDIVYVVDGTTYEVTYVEP